MNKTQQIALLKKQAKDISRKIDAANLEWMQDITNPILQNKFTNLLEELHVVIDCYKELTE